MRDKTLIANLLTSFIAIRTVQATPAKRQEFYELIDKPMPTAQSGDDDGYLVVNNGVSERNVDGFDGYVSWLPKLAFDEQYKPNHTVMERLEIEISELQSKKDKLSDLLSRDRPQNISQIQWLLLNQQEELMADYLFILRERKCDIYQDILRENIRYI